MQITFKANDGSVKTGKVVGSRVGDFEVFYYVELDQPVKYRWRDQETTSIIVRKSAVIQLGSAK